MDQQKGVKYNRLDIDNGELQKEKKITRGGTEQLRKRNKEDHKRRRRAQLL